MTRPWGVIWPWVWQQASPHDCFSRGLPGLGLSAFTHGGCFSEQELDWFPRMQAMSLVSRRGGEQNRVRILQDKLSATMKLVSHLTAQLSELKEPCAPYILASAGSPGCGQGPSPPAWGSEEKWWEFSASSAPFLLVFLLGLGWRRWGPLESWMEGTEAAPTPMLLRAGRAGLSATSRRWGFPPRAPHPHPAAARLWPRR